MGHQYNERTQTPMKMPIIFGISVQIGAAGAVGAIEQCDAGFIDSVVLVSPGLYRFKINGNHRPHKEVVILARVAPQTAATNNRQAYYDNGTYNATTGEFDIGVTDATPAAANPASGDALHVWVCMPFFKNM